MALDEGERETNHDSPQLEGTINTALERPTTPAGPARNLTRGHDDIHATLVPSDPSLKISAPPLSSSSSSSSSDSSSTASSTNSQRSILNDAASENDTGTINATSNDAVTPHPLSPTPARSSSQNTPYHYSESASMHASTLLPTQAQPLSTPQNPPATTNQSTSSTTHAPTPTPPTLPTLPPPVIIQQPPAPPTLPNAQPLSPYQNVNGSSEKRHDDGSECSVDEKKRCCGDFNRAKWIGTISCTLAPCSCYSQGSGVLGNVACCLVWPVTTIAGLVWGVANCVTCSCCGLCG